MLLERKLLAPSGMGLYYEVVLPGRVDVVVELVFYSHPKSRRYEVRLIAIRPAVKAAPLDAVGESMGGQSLVAGEDWLLDLRHDRGRNESMGVKTAVEQETALLVESWPTQWKELRLWQHQSLQTEQPLALAYAPPETVDPVEKWKLLLGLAKYLSREQVAVSRERLGERLAVRDRKLA